MYCPECGHDAGDAKFCPECGVDLESIRNTQRGKTTGQQRAGRSRQDAAEGPRGRGADGSGGQATAQQSAKPAAWRGYSAAMIWGVFGALAVVVIVVVVMLSGGFGGNSPAVSQGTNSPSATPVQGVVTGSYSALVTKANSFYDKGDTYFQNGDLAQGSAYFQAAAMTYAAAWKKKQTDPGVGTDFATSLFYSGDIDAAVNQVNTVIKKYPDYQAGFFNLGNYLAHKGRIDDQQGQKQKAKQAYAAAKQAFAKAVSLDPSSSVGKQADAGLKSLPK